MIFSESESQALALAPGPCPQLRGQDQKCEVRSDQTPHCSLAGAPWARWGPHTARRSCPWGRVTYFTWIGPGHGRVGGECGEEGVAEFRHEHVRVQQRVLLHGDWCLPAIPVLVPVKHIIILPPTGEGKAKWAPVTREFSVKSRWGDTWPSFSEQQGLPGKRRGQGTGTCRELASFLYVRPSSGPRESPCPHHILLRCWPPMSLLFLVQGEVP